MICKALTDAIGMIGPIEKNRQGDGIAYKFRGIDDVYNTIQPVLAQCGIVIVPSEIGHIETSEITTKRGGKMLHILGRVSFKFYANDGSFVECVSLGEAMDSGDKAGPKFMSCAMKYACFQVFCIPTDEPLDTENADPQRADPPGPTPTKRTPAKRGARGKGAQDATFATLPQRKKIFATMEERTMGEADLKKVLQKTTGQESTKSIPRNKVTEILELLNAWMPEGVGA